MTSCRRRKRRVPRSLLLLCALSIAVVPVLSQDDAACACTDVPPSADFSCAEQRSFGQCDAAWMSQSSAAVPNGFCQVTCGRCPCPTTNTCVCDDLTPPGGFTCAQQRSFDKCGASWMIQTGAGRPNGYCAQTCGRCVCDDQAVPVETPEEPETVGGSDCTCTDVQPPSGELSCEQQREFGKCTANWMRQTRPELPAGYCQYTCGFCPCEGAPRLNDVELPVWLGDAECTCSDVPPNGEFSCAEQRALGKCLVDWMRNPVGLNGGYCQITCGLCPCRDPEIVGQRPDEIPEFLGRREGERIPIDVTFSDAVRLPARAPGVEPVDEIMEPPTDETIEPAPETVEPPTDEPMEPEPEVVPTDEPFEPEPEVVPTEEPFEPEPEVIPTDEPLEPEPEVVPTDEPLEPEPELPLPPEDEMMTPLPEELLPPIPEPVAESPLADIIASAVGDIGDERFREGAMEVEDDINLIYEMADIPGIADIMGGALDQILPSLTPMPEPTTEPMAEPEAEFDLGEILGDTLLNVTDDRTGAAEAAIQQGLEDFYEDSVISAMTDSLGDALERILAPDVAPAPEPDEEDLLLGEIFRDLPTDPLLGTDEAVRDTVYEFSEDLAATGLAEAVGDTLEGILDPGPITEPEPSETDTQLPPELEAMLNVPEEPAAELVPPPEEGPDVDASPSPVVPSVVPSPEAPQPGPATDAPAPSQTPGEFSDDQATEILGELNVQAQNISDTEDVLPPLTGPNGLDIAPIELPDLEGQSSTGDRRRMQL